MSQTFCMKLWFKYKWEISECPWGRLEVWKREEKKKPSNEVITAAAAAALSVRRRRQSCFNSKQHRDWRESGDSWVLYLLLKSGLQVKYCVGEQAQQWIRQLAAGGRFRPHRKWGWCTMALILIWEACDATHCPVTILSQMAALHSLQLQVWSHTSKQCAATQYREILRPDLVLSVVL